MSLLRYAVTRALAIVPTVLILYTVVFIVLRVIPGDPVSAALGTRSVPPEELEAIRERLGLNQPLWRQYVDYLLGVLRGDFGESMTLYGRPVARDILERFPATLELTIFGFMVSVVLGVGSGVAAAFRGGLVDRLLRTSSIVAYTLFIPWLGLMLKYVFSIKLGILPTGGRIDPRVDLNVVTGLYVLDSIITANPAALVSAIEHLILPSLTLGIVLSGVYTRLVRIHVAEALRSEVAIAYRARGLRESRIAVHMLRISLIPTITMMGLQFAILLGGAVLTEAAFSWPGLGSLLVERISYRDYSTIQGVTVFFAFMVGMVSLIVDIIYAIVNPRVRY
ncbi:ABC transporter permease [Aeropyrum camini]|uniref:Dipeptide ABC transporter permease DppB n=1 Tax=Aeropyrum camini SY1 = JCM 12091 TaxID=1198449 RepID=U3TBG3_9CREN|nr:ABC transporter permease [Aeropyrum camini]BAN90882.1 dipeptide ABC transporter permease DppB [Aeropyrum camini SY1 = JCM 12091]